MSSGPSVRTDQWTMDVPREMAVDAVLSRLTDGRHERL